MTDALIEKTLEQGVLWLTLNNAEQRNPLSSTMLAEITSSLETAYDHHEVRCIVIAGRGPVFSAGLIKSLQGNDNFDTSNQTEEEKGFFSKMKDVFGG